MNVSTYPLPHAFEIFHFCMWAVSKLQSFDGKKTSIFFLILHVLTSFL